MSIAKHAGTGTHEPVPASPRARLSTVPATTSSTSSLCCSAHLNDGPLLCVRTDPHDCGHIYRSGRGSEVDDRHGDGGHG